MTLSTAHPHLPLLLDVDFSAARGIERHLVHFELLDQRYRPVKEGRVIRNGRALIRSLTRRAAHARRLERILIHQVVEFRCIGDLDLDNPALSLGVIVN